MEVVSDNKDKEGRGIYVGEIKQDQGTQEMTTEITRIEQEEDQGTGVTDALPETHDVEMQRNTYTDGAVTVGT